MSNIKISVVIPTYNRPALLSRAIESVLGQEFDQSLLEIIVVDDCSDIQPQIPEFAGRGVKLISLTENAGPQIARNTGIGEASGEWVLMLDDDDELVDGALETAMASIDEVDNNIGYPVFFFATTNGHIPKPFMLIGPADIMNGTLSGDFTPVLNRLLWHDMGFSYLDFPQIHGVGCEQLSWLHISSRTLIPSFGLIITKVNQDAPMRLTSYDNFIRNSYKFALQQDISIDFVKTRDLEKLAPTFVDKKILGAAIYYLVSGNKAICRDRLTDFGTRGTWVSRILWVLSYFPIFVSRFLFLKYKRTFSK